MPVRRGRTVLHAVGFWSEGRNGVLLPHPSEFVDPDMPASERERTAAYLAGGYPIADWEGWATNRFKPNEDSNPELGCADLTDGVWYWPEGLSIYVLRYSVRLPGAFLAHMAARGYQPPPHEELEMITRYRISQRYWVNWSRWNRKNRRMAWLSLLIPYC